jgi:hypothetical protein
MGADDGRVSPLLFMHHQWDVVQKSCMDDDGRVSPLLFMHL